MKIYQIHEYSGEYEDYMDRIVGSYLLQARAEEEKQKLESREAEFAAQSKKCHTCPIWNYASTTDIGEIIAKHGDYCDEAKLLCDDVFGIDCENYFTLLRVATYTIEEVEVVE